MIPFNNSYAKLPKHFFAKTLPEQVPSPSLVKINQTLAKELNIDPHWLESNEGLAILSGNQIAEGSEPISLAYAGHQFGGWVPQLGDGRAVLLGEVIHRDGSMRDIQLKGSGKTPFSRNGDGKSPLGPVIREYLISEAMHALGVPTTRALAAVTTGEKVHRESPLDGGIFTRVASSHLRIGTFQYFGSRNDTSALETITQYALKRHYPDGLNAKIPALTLLENVITAQAKLIAHWMSLGFIHGVMNTDNITISGETIDYGPCAFMDVFHPQCVFSYIDQNARYAWGNQPSIAHWNLCRLAETLMPLLSPDQEKALKLAQQALKTFSEQFSAQYHLRFSHKFGIAGENSIEFIQDSLAMLAEQQVDFTLFFRHLTLTAENNETSELEKLFTEPKICRQWIADWKQRHDTKRIAQMRSANPILIPRNHLVERAINDAYTGDYTLFHSLVEAWNKPYSEPNHEHQAFENPPSDKERVRQTFCGT